MSRFREVAYIVVPVEFVGDDRWLLQAQVCERAAELGGGVLLSENYKSDVRHWEPENEPNGLFTTAGKTYVDLAEKFNDIGEIVPIEMPHHDLFEYAEHLRSLAAS